MAKGRVAGLLVVCLLANVFCVPIDVPRTRRASDDNEVDSENRGDIVTETTTKSDDEPSKVELNPAVTLPPTVDTYEQKKMESQTPEPDDDDDDDDFDEPMETSSTRGGGGSNILSLLNLANGLFPGSSGANFQVILRNMIRELLRRNQPTITFPVRRQDIRDNVIDIDYTLDLKPPPFQRQEDDDSNGDDSEESDDNNAAEESLEDNDDDGNTDASQQNSDSKPASDGNGNDDNDSDYDSDEPPGGGDGQGGGILGILAGLSGGEDGQSDLGSLLATVSGIVANLSGDGFDLNSLIASGIGLFVGLLSEGEENPGAVIASYLLTSLDTLTGGGSKNNGAFFGAFLSKLIRGTSAGGDPDASSEENGNAEEMKDSAGFLLSFLMGLSGDMSKGSSKGSSHPWR